MKLGISKKNKMKILLGVAFVCVGLRVTAQAEKSCL